MYKMNFEHPDKKKDSKIVSGLHLTLVRIGVGFTILWISFRIGRNPVKAIALLRSLIKERINLHENAGNFKAVKSGSRYYWSVNMPGWPSDTFNLFIRNEFLRINSPEKSNLQTIIFAITNLCPLNCLHCYESENISKINSLSSDDLKIVIDKICKNGIRHIQFSGGEPLSRFSDMIELMGRADKATDFWINTSGFGLTIEKAHTMKHCGMTGAIISLDDWDEIRHNNFRQNSRSFYWVQEAARNCKDAGLIVCLSVCPVRDFVSEENLDRLYHLAKNMGAGFLRIFEPRKAGRFAGKDVLLNSEQIEIVHRFMVSRNSDLVYRTYPIIQFPGHSQRQSGCLGAGNRYLYIDSNGNFHACPFCRQPLGNVLYDSIESGIARARTKGCHEFKQRILN
jgi:MoaA/NifB/PqqE/SkfB family radical SAM enzyme